MAHGRAWHPSPMRRPPKTRVYLDPHFQVLPVRVIPVCRCPRTAFHAEGDSGTCAIKRGCNLPHGMLILLGLPHVANLRGGREVRAPWTSVPPKPSTGRAFPSSVAACIIYKFMPFTSDCPPSSFDSCPVRSYCRGAELFLLFFRPLHNSSIFEGPLALPIGGNWFSFPICSPPKKKRYGVLSARWP